MEISVRMASFPYQFATTGRAARAVASLRVCDINVSGLMVSFFVAIFPTY